MSTDTLLFLTDTHVGGDETGFCYQPRRADLLPAMADALAGVVRECSVDLAIHGGDHVEQFTDERIDQACGMLAGLGCPAAACLGNHDLTVPDALDTWRARRGRHAGITWADAVVPLACCDVILLDNTWRIDGQVGAFWTHGQPSDAVLNDGQLAWLDGALSCGPADRPAVLVMHAPLNPIATRLSGRDAPAPLPYPDTVAAVEAVLDRHPRVRLVLGGHNHVNMVCRRPGRLHVTATSMLEAPFEYRLIRVGPRSLEISTRAAIESPADTALDARAAWVLGQSEDRHTTLSWE